MLSVESQVVSCRSVVMETSGMESPEIDRRALQSGQRPTVGQIRNQSFVSTAPITLFLNASFYSFYIGFLFFIIITLYVCLCPLFPPLFHVRSTFSLQCVGRFREIFQSVLHFQCSNNLRQPFLTCHIQHLHLARSPCHYLSTSRVTPQHHFSICFPANP